MSIFRNKYFKIIAIIFMVPFVPTLLYLGMTAIGLFVSTNPEKHLGSKDYTIYIAVESIHADFILPVQNDVIDWRTIVDPKDFNNISPNPKFIQIGWGDEVFYLEMGSLKNLNPDITFRATFLPTDSLMHVTYFYNLPYKYIDIRKINITKEQYQKLVDFVKIKFKYENKKAQLLKGKSYYWNDNFYKAEGKYHLFNTCNLWTNRGLKETDIKTSIWSPLKYGIRNFLPAKEK